MVHNWKEWFCTKPLPADAVKGGLEDGEVLYVGRFDATTCGKFRLYTGLLKEPDCLGGVPAKVAPHCGNKAYTTSHNGKEIVSEKYEILCGNKVAWVPSKVGEVPPNAIEVGVLKDDCEEIKLYVGRAFHMNNLINGLVAPFNGGLHLGYKGEEYIFGEYEILMDITCCEKQ